MAGYKAITHFKLKAGKEREALRFLQEEVVNVAHKNGAHDTEVLVSDSCPNLVVGTSVYDTLHSSMKMMKFFEAHKEIMEDLFEEVPKREILKIQSKSRAKKAA